MSNLREQFRATSMKTLKRQIEKDDLMVGTQQNEYLQLEDGKTVKIRIYPAHPGGDNFYVPRKSYWLPLTGKNGDTYRGTVNDSVRHGGTTYDIVEEYVKRAKRFVGSDVDKLDAISGTGPKSNSLNPQYSWICYAAFVNPDEELHPKLWEFKKMVRDGINKLAYSEDSDEAIEVDPFTDPDDGCPITVTYNKNPNKKKGENFYEVSFPRNVKARPLSDDELEAFAKLKPLGEVIPKYGMSDFERALGGLQNFDEENEIGLFEDEEWLEMVEKIKNQYDAEESEEEEEKPKAKKTVKKEVKKTVKAAEPEDDDEADDEPEAPESNNDEEDEFDEMDRSELKRYINENELDITVKKSMSDDDIRQAIRAELVFGEQAPEADDEPEAPVKENKPKAKVSLEDIRKKIAKNQ